MLQKKRGCFKPGVEIPGAQVFSFTSPLLQTDRLLYECPTGRILRESPFMYDLIDRCSLSENASPGEFSRFPRLLQQASRLYSSEKNRLWEIKLAKQKAKSDSQYGRRVREDG